MPTMASAFSRDSSRLLANGQVTTDIALLLLLHTMKYLLLLSLLSSVGSYPSWLQCFVDLDETEVVMNHHIIPAAEVEIPVHLEISFDQEGWTTHALTYPPNVLSNFHIRLNIPESLRQRDVQWVAEASKGAMFTAPILCQGRRSHSNRPTQALPLTVDASAEKVDVWAGWATGHEAVKLTPVLTLYRQDAVPEL